jgi:hypothetical protein
MSARDTDLDELVGQRFRKRLGAVVLQELVLKKHQEINRRTLYSRFQSTTMREVLYCLCVGRPLFPDRNGCQGLAVSDSVLFRLFGKISEPVMLICFINGQTTIQCFPMDGCFT